MGTMHQQVTASGFAVNARQHRTPRLETARPHADLDCFAPHHRDGAV
ncbi:hypothetical protein J5X84_15505 [Streptosporangiaceae bacterium NEAU-GS5]|nr:hypothetical protein [Streptosporangiaceae bacterium NEAU-GS5]